MKSYFNNRLIYSSDTNIVYYTDFYKKYNADISSGWLNGKLNDEQIKSFKF